MKIELDGDAAKLVNDLVKYGEMDPEAVAEALCYDTLGFKQRLASLKKAMKCAGE